MKLRLIFALTIATYTAGCVTGGGGTQPGGTTPAAKAVDIANINTMINKKDIYIGHFGVTFMTQDKSSSKSSSPMIRSSRNSDYAQAVLTAKLTGVPPSTLQAITDGAYKNLVKDLQAKGYNVKSYNELKQQKGWAKVSPLETPYSPIQIDNFLSGKSRQSVSYAPTDMALLYGPDMLNPYALSVIASESNIPVLAVNHTIHFAYFDKEADYEVDYSKFFSKNGGGTTQTLSASVSLGQGIQVTHGSGFLFMVDQGGTFSSNGHVKLKDPVVVLGAYGSNEDTTSTLMKGVNTFNSVAGLFSGKSSESKEISINANPEYYQYGAIKAITEANSRLSNALPSQN